MEKSQIKICFVSPYIPDHFGGGEKYLLDCARLASTDHQVFVAVPEKGKTLSSQDLEKIKVNYENFLGQSLAQVKFINSPIFGATSFFNKLLWTKNFDIIYYQTDGSLFFSLAKKNILHVQIPFINSKMNPIDRWKLSRWNIINTNSKFTKKVIEKSWQVKVDLVHQPMIAQPDNNPKQKEKIILNVGRFFTHLHSKRQDVLIENFIQLNKGYPKQMKDWKLVLVGKVEDEVYLDKLVALAKGYRIEFCHQVDRKKLEDYYKQASIYWHATGFDVDEEQHPEKVEHFGITTIEAMSYGCVPVVVGKGGQVEIMNGDLAKLMWQTKDECQKITIQLIKSDKDREEYSQLAMQRSEKFSQDEFKQKLEQMLYI